MSSNSLISDSPLHRLIPITEKFCKRKARNKVIEENNLKLIEGKFTANEIQLLRQNWTKFCDEYKVSEELKNRLVGYFAHSRHYTKQQRIEIKKFLREEKFLLRMAYGLPNRTLFSILNCCRRKFCSLKKMRQFTSDDKDMILNLKSVWGSKWTKIAEKVKCNPQDINIFIQTNYNKNGLPFKKGHWSTRENRKLIKAIKKMLNTSDLSDKLFTKNIPWVRVRDASKLNRSANDCQLHWKVLRWKVANFDCLENWSKSDSAKLIYVLFKCNYMNEFDIDWDFIKEKFANITSFNNLCKNWQIIKTMVPDFHIKSYKHVINFLYDNFLPNFIKTDEDLKALEEFYNS